MRSVPSAAEFLGLRTPLQEAKEQLEEMQLIYSRLYSDSSADHEWASDRIQSLKFRFVRLSVGMECSLRLLRAISAHVSLPPNAHARDADTAESLLALAIVRFIGLVTEKEQKRLKTIPMQSLAREMGIGEDIVNLRHQAAHSELPAVDRLFDAATRAFHWLKREFWELEIKRLQAAVNHMEMKIERESSKVQASQDHLKRALDRYLTLKNMQFQGKEPVNPQELRKALAKAISHLCEAEAVSSTAIDLLLKNLLPSEDQEDDEISPSVETEFFQLWQPLMEGMPRTLLIQLLYALLRYQSTNRAAVRRATEWATFLSSKQSALHVEPADLTHTALLNATLSNTEVLLPRLLDSVYPLDGREQRKKECLLRAAKGVVNIPWSERGFLYGGHVEDLIPMDTTTSPEEGVVPCESAQTIRNPRKHKSSSSPAMKNSSMTAAEETLQDCSMVKRNKLDVT